MNVLTIAVRTELSASTIWMATAASVHRDTGTENTGNPGSMKITVDTVTRKQKTGLGEHWKIKLDKPWNNNKRFWVSSSQIHIIDWFLFLTLPLLLLLFSGEFCEVALPPLSPCQLALCQNGASCVEKTETVVCQCLSGFEGQSCEKLVSVNFVDRDSYVQLQDVKNWPQANITLQVRIQACIQSPTSYCRLATW